MLNIVKTCEDGFKLILNFASASDITKDLAALGDYMLPHRISDAVLVDSFNDGDDRESCYKNFIRKTGSNFGYNWAPKIALLGIWQSA
ncbi:hypothetical protein N7448_004729 [Penicillium atrosanguineum]|uniref:Uncharacterized protein n=1 Tax=Penicillium atrosanguineum TaxID=1132637 RepID=A0A9W9H2B2_9EURO|nr:Glycoside hydrolase family 47 [Penicillium atrosanguineum]KAJ5125408.1 hypothetical protein N7526_007585 [Penicillium atrosanguineum]KAJ5136175.1 hypothetical protein N7448_004729 [Penicillium atrosanguineum]KAJ5292525.1 Glycoside hydrolase family 47 [Penicillium atrosanguineum]KAJ5303452.1 hypothetical protein N7476_010251 [Penicillium atrosanguineum]